MKKWIAGVAATVVSALLIVWLTPLVSKNEADPPGGTEGATLTPQDPLDVVDSTLAQSDMSPEVKKLLRDAVELGDFQMDVIREGKYGESYSKTVSGIQYRFTPSDVYIDGMNRECRDVQTSKFINGAWLDLGKAHYYKEHGEWKTDNT